MSRSSNPRIARRVDIFCRVIDNLGDVGVCWRLARQLANEFECAVKLIVDQLEPFAKIEPRVQLRLMQQEVLGVRIMQWSAFENAICSTDIVVEAFACDPPPNYVQSMAASQNKPIWINLEYLSAEGWVDGVHGLPSPHPKLPLTKYFFVPGFSEKSGGVICERSIKALTDHSTAAAQKDEPTKLFVFAYPHAPLRTLAAGFAAANQPLAVSLAANNHDAASDWLTVASVPQTQFDALLSTFDVLIVRGEDSFVRAQLAGKPMLWHIYPTEDRAHLAKLDAWLARYCAALDEETAQVYRHAAHALVDPANDETDLHAFANFARKLPRLRTHAIAWQNQLMKRTDLATQLLEFCAAKQTAQN
jgi:uncharacterized repeat protein (TIGR03837 family)